MLDVFPTILLYFCEEPVELPKHTNYYLNPTSVYLSKVPFKDLKDVIETCSFHSLKKNGLESLKPTNYLIRPSCSVFSIFFYYRNTYPF